MSLLKLHNFSVSFDTTKVVKNINLEILPNSIVALIGESGSGKSVTAKSITRLINGANIQGECIFDDVDLIKCSSEHLQQIRRRGIAYIFQEPMTALNPLIKCGEQIAECFPADTNEESRLKEILLQVELEDWHRAADSYPHELSGGQRQRIMIAMALAKEPKLLIADEPTTALDVAVQTEILQLLRKLCKESNLSVLFITHDLLSLKAFADEIAVMYHGEIVEFEKSNQILNSPKHPYTKALLQSRATYNKKGFELAEVEDLLVNPDVKPQKQEEIKVGEDELLGIENLQKSHFKKSIFKKTETKVLHGVSFKLNKGDSLGLIGESGSGKSTIAKIILRIWDATEGEVIYNEQPLNDYKNLEETIQLVFQDPFSSLNPKHTAGASITEVCKTVGGDRNDAIQLLEEVGLTADDYIKYPHEFSGGQRQRICIAKALAKKPKILVLDEAVSALDVSVQAKILNLLNRLKQEKELTYLLISHDLNVVSYFCNKVVILKEGIVIEQGATDQLISNPTHDYTRQLLEHSVH